MFTYDPSRDLASELIDGTIRLWQLPEALRGLYFLGEHDGMQAGKGYALARLEALESECDYLYRRLYDKSYTEPRVPESTSFAELCRRRGAHELAAKVEADWARLIADEKLSRRELIEERAKPQA